MSDIDQQNEAIRERIATLRYDDLMGMRRKLGKPDPFFPNKKEFWKAETGGEVYDNVVNTIGYQPDVYSMTAGCVRTILELMDIAGARRVLELGAGISTLCTAKYLSDHGTEGAEIFSVEQDGDHADRVGTWLSDMTIDKIASVHCVSMASCNIDTLKTATYDINQISEALDQRDPFDLLVIDGPKSGGSGGVPHSRLPTVPLLKKWMRPGALVVLDDSFRDMEITAVEVWVNNKLVEPVGYSIEGKGLFIGRMTDLAGQ